MPATSGETAAPATSSAAVQRPKRRSNSTLQPPIARNPAQTRSRGKFNPPSRTPGNITNCGSDGKAE